MSFFLVILMPRLPDVLTQWRQNKTHSILASNADDYTQGYRMVSDREQISAMVWNDSNFVQYYIQKISSNGIRQLRNILA